MFTRAHTALVIRGLAMLVFACTACGGSPADVGIASAQAWEAADGLFRDDARWLGGDVAVSIPLGEARDLWLFGDSFVATSDARDRRESEMVRNTLAIVEGTSPIDARIAFVWRDEDDGSPGPFFVDDGPIWFWPGHGIRLEEGPLVIFLMAVRATPGEGLGFAEAGYRVVVIDDPDAPPDAWVLRWFAPSTPAADPGVFLGTAVLREGDTLFAYASAKGSKHEGWLARFSVAEIMSGTVEPQWWAGSQRGWLGTQALGSDAPARLADDIGSENSVHFEPRIDAYFHVASRGFGATTIAARTSPATTTAFSRPIDVFTPPESKGSKPFVYAAKAHPQLDTGSPDGLAVTYATNAFEFGDLFTETGQTDLYYPRFVILRFAGNDP